MSAAWKRLPLLISAVALSAACGQTSRDEPKDPPADVSIGNQCSRYTLDDYCASRSCPASQAEAEADAPLNCPSGAGGFTTYRQPTACGGAALGNPMGYRFFDAAGNLVGVTFSSDTGSNGCGDDVPGFGKTTVYGEVCALAGEPVSLCPEP